MSYTSRSEIFQWIAMPGVAVGLYIGAYLLSTEIVHGRLGNIRYRIRLFRSVWHQRVFIPLLSTEQRLRPATYEFSGQVRSGASLPPHDDE